MLRNLAQAWRNADRTHRIGTLTTLLAGILALIAAALMPDDWAGALELRESRGKAPRVEDYAQTWSWIVALSNGWILVVTGVAGLAITLKHGKLTWLSGDDTIMAPDLKYPPGALRTWAIGAFVILLIAVGVRWPRMDLSLYYDEGYSLLRYIDGDFKRKPGEDYGGALPEFQRVSWTHTFFGNRHGNNNVFQSLLSRVCYDTWRTNSEAVDGQINETALRLPVLIFGVASIGLLGRLLFSIAPFWVSWLGMLWAALHPWHVRYSTEARGYGIAFLFMLGALGALVRAIETNRPRWWLTFLLCQVGYMYSFPGAASFALALSGTAVIWLIVRKVRGGAVEFFRSRFLALALVNAASVLIFWQLMAPCLPQLRQAVATFWSMGGGPEPGWWTDLPFYLVYGQPWTQHSANLFASTSFENSVLEPIAILGILGVSAVAALGWWSGRKKMITWLIGGALLAAPVAYLVSSITDSILQKWYVVYLVLSLVFLFALGCGWLVRKWKWTGIAIVSAMVGSLLIESAWPLLFYSTVSKEQLKDVVIEVRGDVFPFENERELPILAAVWSHSTRLYDPYLRIIRTEEDLDRIIAEAEESGRRLAVAVGEIEKAWEHHPTVMRRIRDTYEFEHTYTFYGLEDRKFAQDLFRWRRNEPR